MSEITQSEPNGDDLIRQVEDFLNENRQEKVGFVSNPHKIKETKLDPTTLEEQLQEGIRNALTSDYAETVETLEPREEGYPLASGRFLRRYIYLRWDGTIPTDESLGLRDDRTEPQIKVYPYQLSLSVSGYSVDLAKLKTLPENKTVSPVWPDRAEFYMINRKNHEATSVNLIVSNPSDTSISHGATLSWFQELKEGGIDPATADLELLAYNIKRAGSYKDRFNTLYKDFTMLRNILMFGELDLPVMLAVKDHLIERHAAKLIQDPKSMSLVSAYFLNAMDKLFPEIANSVKDAWAHQTELNR